jgi:tRNA threonylcarbamoyladenosine biosynthesis protein TsaB
MRILALDCAAAGCSVAWLEDHQVRVLRQEAMARGQDARLIPLVQDVMQEAGHDLPALDRSVVLRGPGSFTGIRIGLAAARGLGLALGKPVLGIDRLWLHHASLVAAGEQADCLVVLDSRRDELFCQLFSKGKAQSPFVATAAALGAYDYEGLVVCGDAAQQAKWHQASFKSLPAAEIVCAAQLAHLLRPEEHVPVPLYLRAPDVSCGPAPAMEEAVWSA